MSVRMMFVASKLQIAGGTAQNSPNGLVKSIRMPSGIEINLPSFTDPYLDIGSNIFHAEVPERLDANLVEYFTAIENLRISARPIGEYRYKTAKAIVTHHSSSDCSHHVQYRAKKLSDLQELHRLFCEGLIWPVTDHEAKMAPSPARHLRQLVREGWAIIRRDTTLRFRRV